MNRPAIQLPVYLDYNATTPVDPRVLEAMNPFFSEQFGNPASIDHLHGTRASQATEQARATISKTLNAKPEELIFTSGATEADNLALIGVMEANADRGDHLVTCRTEHPAILETGAYLKSRGKQVTVLDVDSSGLVDPAAIERAITDRTVLVSLMAVNNEIGTVAPLAEIGQITRKRGILFHTDATQAIGKIEIDVQKLNIDLMSISSHKIYGPKGIGALYARRRNPFVRITPIIHGGGHERGFRSGTVNTSGVVGFAKAIELCNQIFPSETKRMEALGKLLLDEVLRSIPGAELNGHLTKRVPNCMNLYIPQVENKSLIVSLRDMLSFSAGSACATSKVEPSHVLLALGHAANRSYNSVRLSLGRFTTEDDVRYAAVNISSASAALRARFANA